MFHAFPFSSKKLYQLSKTNKCFNVKVEKWGSCQKHETPNIFLRQKRVRQKTCVANHGVHWSFSTFLKSFGPNFFLSGLSHWILVCSKNSKFWNSKNVKKKEFYKNGNSIRTKKSIKGLKRKITYCKITYCWD